MTCRYTWKKENKRKTMNESRHNAEWNCQGQYADIRNRLFLYPNMNIV